MNGTWLYRYLNAAFTWISSTRSQGSVGAILTAPPVTNMAANLESSFSRFDDDFVDFVFRTYDVVCGSARELPALKPTLKDLENPIELYNVTEFLIRYRFTKRTLCHLLELLPLESSVDNRGDKSSPYSERLYGRDWANYTAIKYFAFY